MGSQSFREVLVWQKAHVFVLDVYRITRGFPRSEMFGLTSQLRRAAVSIPANFAEGFKKRGRADKARLYNIAQGSIEECKYYLILAEDLEYATTGSLQCSLEEISRMLQKYLEGMWRLRRPTDC